MLLLEVGWWICWINPLSRWNFRRWISDERVFSHHLPTICFGRFQWIQENQFLIRLSVVPEVALKRLYYRFLSDGFCLMLASSWYKYILIMSLLIFIHPSRCFCRDSIKIQEREHILKYYTSLVLSSLN